MTEDCRHDEYEDCRYCRNTEHRTVPEIIAECRTRLREGNAA